MNSSSDTIPSAATRPLELRIDSDPARIADVRHAVERLARAAGFTLEAEGHIGLCVNEALANVIRHAYKGASDRPIAVSAEYRDGAMRVTIRDWGNGVDPATQPPKPRDPLTPGGLGMVCLRRAMDDVVFTPQPDGMLLTMIKRKGAGG